MERPADTDHGIPTNRRSHSSTHYMSNINNSSNNSSDNKEYMIVSGGFTDDDFDSFPVWAFDLSHETNASDPIETGHEVGLWNLLDAGYDGYYKDVIHTGVVANNTTNDTALVPATTTAPPLRPSPRIGHISGMDNNGTIYVFGGIHVNNDKQPSADHTFWTENELCIWSASVNDVLASASGSDGDGDTRLSWTKRTEFNSNANGSASASASLPANRGESGGGVWKEENALVFYGGLHISEAGELGEPLGDVWVYYFDTHTFEELAPHPSDNGKNVAVPQPRVSHAATVVKDKLYVFGGMGQHYPEDVYVVFNDGGASTIQWSTLSDVWEFDLRNRMWNQRHMKPRLARAYHSIVVLEDETLVSYGGYRQAEMYTGQVCAFPRMLISNIACILFCLFCIFMCLF